MATFHFTFIGTYEVPEDRLGDYGVDDFESALAIDLQEAKEDPGFFVGQLLDNVDVLASVEP